MAVFRRRESPSHHSNYQSYRPFLRRVERTEEYLGGEEAFEVEHFPAEEQVPEPDLRI
jgi:hypothetical protein